MRSPCELLLLDPEQRAAGPYLFRCDIHAQYIALCTIPRNPLAAETQPPPIVETPAAIYVVSPRHALDHPHLRPAARPVHRAARHVRHRPGGGRRLADGVRSEERRGGKECVSTWRSRWLA